jgi:hypothetical protein
LWLSGGYNFYGYRDEDFANGEYTNKGTYLRLRYKFDEDLFAGRKQQGGESGGKAALEKSTVEGPDRGKNGNNGGNEKN